MKPFKDGKCDPSSTYEGRLNDQLFEELKKVADKERHTAYLFMSYIKTLDSDYRLKLPLKYLNRRKLSDIIHDTDVMSDTYRPLSELILQRKITEEEDEQKAAIEVELILWEHGRNQIIQNESESRTSG